MVKRSFRSAPGKARRAVLAGSVAAAALGLGVTVGTACAASTPSISDYTQTGTMNDAWILPAKNYDNTRYVELSQITPADVKNLKPVWSYKLSDDGPTEATPVIWHGTAYITSAHDHVYAIDVATGKLKWEFSDNPHVISFAASRGVTLLDGNVYFGTLDGHLVALNAETGKVVFDKQTVKDPTNSFYTQVPMPYHNQTTGKTELLLGVSNGDWGGIGNIAAFDPKTGKRLWQFDTIPGPGQKGNDSWEGDSWKRGGGAVWTQMALDPKTGMLYANAGNPQPDFNISIRKGDNLYTDSLLAIDISGAKPKLAWAHQFIANDSHDWDPVMPPILFKSKTQYHGQAEELVASGDKAGNFWLLNAQTGKLVNHLQVSMQYGQNTAPSRHRVQWRHLRSEDAHDLRAEQQRVRPFQVDQERRLHRRPVLSRRVVPDLRRTEYRADERDQCRDRRVRLARSFADADGRRRAVDLDRRRLHRHAERRSRRL
jgi:alcohol dehydrogenase (cytochrome c)